MAGGIMSALNNSLLDVPTILSVFLCVTALWKTGLVAGGIFMICAILGSFFTIYVMNALVSTRIVYMPALPAQTII